jgi:excisionase family DNA binding protein
MGIQLVSRLSTTPQLPQSNWLTAKEAAQYLKVKPRTLLQWTREGKVPAHKLSGTKRCVWRFLRPELDAMLFPSSAVAA